MAFAITSEATDMANEHCEGDFFTAEGVRYYRCLWDGFVLFAPKPGDKCPHCERVIAGSDAGELAVHTQRFVQLKNGAQALLPRNS